MKDISSISIRDATHDDIPRMFRVSAAAHQQGYKDLIPSEQYPRFIKRYTVNEKNEAQYSKFMSSRINSSLWHVWVAIDSVSQEVLAYTLAKHISDTILYKRGMFVDPRYQGQGVGSLLFKHSLTAIGSGTIRLLVIEANQRAIHIYEKSGFRTVGREENSFFGATRIIMECSVDDLKKTQ